MYKDLKRNFWWLGMKKEITEHVARCATCQMVKIEHQKPGGTPATLGRSSLEMGACVDGFCNKIAQDKEEE